MKTKRHALDFLFVHAEAGLSPFQTGTTTAPLGLVQMTTFLVAQGFRCRVIDTRHSHFTPEGFSAYLQEFRPRFVGFTVLTDTIFTVGRLIRLVRLASPSSQVVLGGAHATVCDEEVLDELGADIVVRGEGEVPALDLLQRQKKPDDARGVSFRRRGKLVRTPAAPLVDMDALPSPDVAVIEGWEQMRYSPAVVTGRGCPYRCTFCCAGILCRKVRWRSIPRVIEDIALARRRLPESFLLIDDDTFTLDPQRTADFCRHIRQIGGGTDFFWYCEGRVDRLARHPALVRQMREAGLILLQLGIESGDERVLAAYRKEITLDDARRLVETCGHERIFLHAGFIIGGAFESRETIARSESFLHDLVEKSQGLIQFNFSFCTPLPGTELALHPERYGIRPLDPRLLSSIAFDNCVTETETLSRLEIMRARRQLMQAGVEALQKESLSWSEDLRTYCDRIFRQVSLFHMAMFLLHPLSRQQKIGQLKLNQIRTQAAKSSSFQLAAGRKWPDLIPARMLLMDIDEHGRYCFPPSKRAVSEVENDILHYACGKHTGRDIARFLGRRLSELAPVFASLEKKRLILYRTF